MEHVSRFQSLCVCLRYFYTYFMNASGYFLQIDSWKWNLGIKSSFGLFMHIACYIPGTCRLIFIPEGLTAWLILLADDTVSVLSLIA